MDIYLPNGDVIDEEATYTVTVNNFMAGGGDNYTALLKGRNQEIGLTDIEGLVNYVKEQGTVSAQIEDRVLKVDLEEATGWILLEDEKGNEYWVYVDPETGDLVVNDWVLYEGEWYYFDSEGIMQTGWVKVNGKWYHLDQEGAMESGWIKKGNRWYYLDEEDGDAKLGWFKVKNKWYYFDQNNADMKTGWVKWKNKWYYLDANNGDMKTGWVFVNGSWYYLSEDGAMKSGWIQLGGKWYFLDSSSGAMKTGWLKSGTKWYYLLKNGSMAVNTTINGYKIGKDGAWIK